MANVTITGLPPVVSLDLTAVFPIVQGNVTQKTTLAAIQGVVTSNVANLSVSNLSVGNLSATAISAVSMISGSIVANTISGNIANTTGGYGNSNVNALLGNLTVDIVPNANNVLNIGSPTKQFKDIYLSNATLYFDSIPLTIVGANTLQVDGENVVTTSNGNSTTQGNVVVSGNVVAGNVIGNVAVSNIVGLGDIATLDLNGNSSTYLNGNGVWAAIATGSTYSNSNVAAYLPVNSSNVSGDYYSATGNVSVGYVGSPFSIDTVISSTPTNVTLEGPSILPFPVSDGQTLVISGATGAEAGINGTWTVSNVGAPYFDIDSTDNTAAAFLTGVTGTVISGGDISATANVTANAMLSQGFYGVSGATPVGNVVVVPGIKGAANKLLIQTTTGAIDGRPGVDLDIYTGDANESGGTPSYGGIIRIQGGDGTTSRGSILINYLGGAVQIGAPGNTTSINGILTVVEDATVGGSLTASLIYNTRVNPRTTSIVTDAPIQADCDVQDQFNMTALDTSATVAAPDGTPVDGQRLTYRILDDGNSQALTWDPIFFDMTGTLPTATVAGKLLYVGVIWNAASSQWDVVSVVQQTV